MTIYIIAYDNGGNNKTINGYISGTLLESGFLQKCTKVAATTFVVRSTHTGQELFDRIVYHKDNNFDPHNVQHKLVIAEIRSPLLKFPEALDVGD